MVISDIDRVARNASSFKSSVAYFSTLSLNRLNSSNPLARMWRGVFFGLTPRHRNLTKSRRVSKRFSLAAVKYRWRSASSLHSMLILGLRIRFFFSFGLSIMASFGCCGVEGEPPQVGVGASFRRLVRTYTLLATREL